MLERLGVLWGGEKAVSYLPNVSPLLFFSSITQRLEGVVDGAIDAFEIFRS